MMVARAVVFEVEEVGRFDATSSSGLFGERRVTVHLRIQRLAKLGLLVQRLPERPVEAWWEPAIRIESFGGLFCRFHEDLGEGPMYCSKLAMTRDGYCEEHAGSWKALYERCAQGDDEACERVAGSVGEEFAVYALDYGGTKLKVGLTQLWRFVWRVAEQPHVAAALVASGPLAEMRPLERELGRRHAATEGAGVKVRERLERAASMLSTSRFEALASRLASLMVELGLEGELHAVTILPRSPPKAFIETEVRGREVLVGRELRLVDYWAGLMVLEDREGKKYHIDKRALLHRALKAELRFSP